MHFHHDAVDGSTGIHGSLTAEPEGSKSSETKQFQRMKMSIIQKIAQKAADIVRMCCYSPSDIAELQRLVSSVRAEDLKYNTELALRFGRSFPSFWPKFAEKVPPCLYTEVYSDDLMNLCIFCLPAGNEIPLHDHPGMYGLLKVIEGSCVVESFTSVGKTCEDGSVPRDAIQVRVHDPVSLCPSDPASLFTPTKRNYHRVSSPNCTTAFFDVLFPPYKSPNRDCHYFSLNTRFPSDGNIGGDQSFGFLLPCSPKNYRCELYAYGGERVVLD
uniref:Cysteine dioxygenase n=1 Tax=Trichuris muris TaxID=70415 RepID=A0A5S6QVV6_TRIMR